MERRHRILLILLLVVVVLGLVLDAFAMAVPARADDGDGWTWPLEPRPEVVDGFDPPDDPYGSGHRGVDLAGRVGQPVLSVADGRVSFVGVIAGRGVVVVDHGAERSTYEPVIGGVRVDQRVHAGDPLGRLELVGSHCWPRACLHLGRIVGETYRDPLALLGGGGPIRLLPFHAPTAASPDAVPRGGGPPGTVLPGTVLPGTTPPASGPPGSGPWGIGSLDRPSRAGPPSAGSSTIDDRVTAAIRAALASLARVFG
jgi:Peptidase family M23